VRAAGSLPGLDAVVPGLMSVRYEPGSTAKMTAPPRGYSPYCKFDSGNATTFRK
jgi:hypothetical protein